MACLSCQQDNHSVRDKAGCIIIIIIIIIMDNKRLHEIPIERDFTLSKLERSVSWKKTIQNVLGVLLLPEK